jgi:hypothetical protein
MSAISQNIIWQYLEWHFYDQPKAILKAWKNFLLFNLNFFSVFPLLKTFVSPLHQYTWSYPRGLDIPKHLEAAFSNLISRILGAILRTILILAGIIFEILILIFGFFIFVGWFIFPALLVFLLIRYV